MKQSDLTTEHYDLIEQFYRKADDPTNHEVESRKEAQRMLSEKWDVSERTIRRWAEKKEIGVLNNNRTDPNKILIYDIETSLIPALVWDTGKTYIRHDQLMDEQKIISISYKWLGEDEVYSLHWDENNDDRKMLEQFQPIFNEANMLLGFNSKYFDDKITRARMAKFNLGYNVYARQYDLYKEIRHMLQIPSKSLKYCCKFFDVEQKLSHEGRKMWEMAQFGTNDHFTNLVKSEIQKNKREYLEKMIEYNEGDIVSTEALFFRLRPFLKHQVHFGVSQGEEKWTCPDTGSKNVSLLHTTWTKAGTIQRVFISNETQTQYKISNKQYMNYLEYQMKNNFRNE